MTNQENQLFGHPKGLFYLFFAELWERFSYYGMRALLTLYMVNEFFLHIKDDAAREEMSIGIFAAYGSLVYSNSDVIKNSSFIGCGLSLGYIQVLPKNSNFFTLFK